MDIEIRLAGSGDAQAIAEIQVRSWQAAYAAFLDPAWLAALSAADWRKGWEPRLALPDRTGPLVAVADGRVAGFSSYGRVDPEHPLPPEYAELYTLYVDPDYYSRGIGAALLGASLRVLAGAGYKNCALWCYEPNEGARRFYEREGWRLNGERRGYDSGPDAIRYVRELRMESACDKT
jgi:GNAT superfamily N-acetyltransferase